MRKITNIVLTKTQDISGSRSQESSGEDEQQLKAFATVVFDDELVVHNIKVVSNGEKLIIAMPSRQVSNGEYKDVVHPITSTFRKQLSDAVISAYLEEKDRPRG